MNDRLRLIEDCRLVQNVLCNTSEIDAELAKVRSELEVVSELSRKAICENARTAMSQTSGANATTATWSVTSKRLNG